MKIEERRRTAMCPCGQEAEGLDLYPADTGVEGVIVTTFTRPENCICEEIPFLGVSVLNMH